MGQPKPLTHLAGRPLIEHVLDRVGQLGDEVLITTNQPEELGYLGIRLAADPAEMAGAGALTGLVTALHAASGERALVVGCDMPFISSALAAHLIGLALEQGPETIVVPRGARGVEPLLSVYPVAVVGTADDLVRSGSQKILDLLDRCSLSVVEPAEIARHDLAGLSFFNVNSMEDLAEAESLHARLQGEEGRRPGPQLSKGR